MASLPSAYPTVSLHLTDPALTPLVSSSSTLNPQSTSSRFRALTDLTTASITAYTSTERLGFGRPQRIMIDTAKNGPIVLHAFLNPEQPQPKATSAHSPGSVEGTTAAAAVLDLTREALRPLSSSTVEDHSSDKAPASEVAAGEETESSGAMLQLDGRYLTNGLDMEGGPQEESAEEGKLAPLLIATVVAPNHDQDARRAIGKLEKLGVEFQRRWVKEQVAHRDDENRDEENTADG